MKPLGLILTFALCFFHIAHAMEKLPKSHYKYQTANQVYTTLVHSMLGEQMNIVPSLELGVRPIGVARYIPGLKKIILDEKAYDICASFQSDSLKALAVILGHEFAHFLNKHQANCFPFQVGINELRLRAQQEEEADLYGVLGAYMAGYKVSSIVPKLLEKIYIQYKFDAEGGEYPPLDIRKSIYNEVKKRIDKNIILFEKGNALRAIGAFEEAALRYETILDSYQQFEIYNNLGAIIIQNTNSDSEDDPYCYPLEIDPQSKLYAAKENYGTRQDPSDMSKIEKRKQLIRARDYIQNALDLYPNYFSGLINRASVNLILGHLNRAEEDIIFLNRFSNLTPQQHGQIELLHGILKAKQNKPLDARIRFKGFYKKNDAVGQMAKHNLNALDSVKADKGDLIIEAEDHLAVHAECKDIPLKGTKKIKLKYCGSASKSKAVFKKYRGTSLMVHLVLSMTTESDFTTQQGIRVGCSEHEIEQAYPQLTKIKSVTHQGSTIYVPERALLFEIRDQEVSAIGIVQKSSL